jgi:hypothetical protein
MNEDVRKLLGGYATGNLTKAEQKALYEAALHDDELFTALADEQALRDLLADPAAKRKLLAVVTKKESPRPQRSNAMIPTAIAAMLVVSVGLGVLYLRRVGPTQVAEVRAPAPVVSEGPGQPEPPITVRREFDASARPKVEEPKVAPPPTEITVSRRDAGPKLAIPGMIPAPASPPPQAASAPPPAPLVSEKPQANELRDLRQQASGAGRAPGRPGLAGAPSAESVEVTQAAPSAALDSLERKKRVEESTSADLREAEPAAKLSQRASEKIRYQFKNEAVEITAVEAGSLVVTANGRVLLRDQVNGGTVRSITPPPNATELVVSLSALPQKDGEGKAYSATGQAAGARAKTAVAPYTVRIPLPKKTAPQK